MENLVPKEVLYKSERITVSRAIDKSQKSTFILKSLNQNNEAEISRLKYEYEVATKYSYSGVVRCLGLESIENAYTLIYEDINGEPLIDFWNSSTKSLELFLTLAIGITENLVELHNYGIIHRDINPANILIQDKTMKVYLIDLESSSLIQTDEQVQIQPESLEGTLSYISPEQTGRMNRSTDSRADLYSLGIIFYELLTEQLPFQGNDPLELLHAHIAVAPVSPQKLNPEIPSSIASMILKLISKNAEERYISAAGLKGDLQLAKELLLNNEEIEFLPGSREQRSVFAIPQKLYGRDSEISYLLEAFDSIVENRDHKKKSLKDEVTRLVMVGGYSGVGKTALINEIHKPILEKKGYFITGKFDQFKRNIPYFSLIQACSQLINQILTESDNEIETWRERVRAACEPNLELILNLIPELIHLSGEGSAVSALPSKEAQARFQRTLRLFISVFARTKQPLVIFLDDLQWADLPTIQFMEYILAENPIPHLMIIGAYRENEIDPLHPVSSLMKNIEEAHCKILKITLVPLLKPYIGQMISETIEHDVSPELSELVYKKTGGNPFFVRQFLNTLYRDGHIYFSESKGWEYDIDQILGAEYSENVVDILADKLRLLDKELQQILKVASCIGSKFDINTLSLATKYNLEKTAKLLQVASQEGVILPIKDSHKILQTIDLESYDIALKAQFKFSHDRVQQAANSLLKDLEKASTHVKIGEALYNADKDRTLHDNLFEVINHLNHGIKNFPKEFGAEIIRLNYAAGEKAMVSFAYEVAHSYFSIAEANYIKYLSSDNELFFNIRFQLSIAKFHIGELKDSENDLLALLEMKSNTHLQLLVYSQLVVVQTSLGKLSDVISICSSVMQLFDVKMSISPTKREIFLNYKRVQAKVFEKDQEQLLSHNELADDEVKIAMDILMNSAGAAYWQNPEFGVLCSLILVELSYEHGNSYHSAFGYSIFGVALLGFGQYDQAYKFGQVALSLNERYQQPSTLVKVPLVFAFSINNWKKSSRESIRIMLNTFNSYSHLNDTVFLGSTLTNSLIIELVNSENHEDIQLNCEKYLDYFKKVQLNDQFYWTYQILAFSKVQNGLDPNWENFEGSIISEEDYVSELRKIQSKVGIHVYHTFKMQQYYLFGDFEKAYEMGLEAIPYRAFVIGMLHSSNELFFFTLTLIWLINSEKLDDQEKEKKDSEIRKNIEQFKLWAEHNPENFSARYHFLHAVYSKQKGDKWEAIVSYEKAFELSIKYNYKSDSGLFAESIGDFYLSENLTSKAKKSYEDALFYYNSGKAHALASQLTQNKIDFDLGENQETTVKPDNLEKGTVIQSQSSLDIQTILKANQALSGEIYQEGLVDRLLSISLESAGATRGLLLIYEKDELFVEAEAKYSDTKKITHLGKPLKNFTEVPKSIINYTVRTSEELVLDEVNTDDRYSADQYFEGNNIFSVACMPIITKQKHTGYLYLENNMIKGAFSKGRLDILKSITAQAAISIENAKLYSTLEAKVVAQTAKLTRIQNLSHQVQNTSDFQDMRSNLKSILYAEFKIEIFNLYVLDAKQEKLVCYSMETDLEIPKRVWKLIQENSFSLTDPLCIHRHVIETRKSFFLPRFRKIKVSYNEQINRDILGMTSLFIVPLIMDSKVYGSISFGDINYQTVERIKHLSKSERSDLDLLGQYVSSALYQALQKEKIQEAQEAVSRAKNEAAVNQLAAHLAHEVNNPLNYIATGNTMQDDAFEEYHQMILGVLTGDDEDSLAFKKELEKLQDKFNRGLEQTNEGQSRIAKVIAEIRAITGVDGLNFTTFDVVPMINEEMAYSLHRNQVKIGEQSIKVTGTDSPIEVLSNQHILARSIRTVISNCIHFAREHKGNEGELYINCKIVDNLLLIEIGNNSFSIKTRQLKNLFDLEKSKSHGTEQIGLAMIKELLHKINVELLLADHGRESGKVVFQLQVPLES